MAKLTAAPFNICPGVSPFTAPAVALANAAPNGPATILPATVANVCHPPGIALLIRSSNCARTSSPPPELSKAPALVVA